MTVGNICILPRRSHRQNIRRQARQQRVQRAHGRVIGDAVDAHGTEVALERGDLVYSPGHVAIMLDESHVVHANGFTMSVAIEPLAALEGRVRKETGGKGFSVVRRIGAG